MKSSGTFRRWAIPLLVTVASVASVAGAQQREEEGDDVQARVRAFREARADEHGVIPGNAWTSAWRSWNALATGRALPGADLAWRPLGPTGFFGNQINFGGIGQLVAGRVTSISVHPGDSQTLFIGAVSGGVWKSTNSGVTWSPLTDAQCAPTIGSIAVDPVNPNIVYAGTGELNTFEFPGCGVLRSTDGGNTWSAPAFNSVGQYHARLVIDPATAGSASQTTLLSATESGLYVSTNSGASWTRKIPGIATGVVANPARPGVFFAAVANSSSFPATTFWRSTNGGQSWAMLTTPAVIGAKFARTELATSPSAPDQIFALCADYSSRKFIGLFRWDDAHSQWTTLPTAGLVIDPSVYPFTFGEQGEYDLVLAVDPHNANRIWIAGVGAFASQDGGLTFRSVARTVHVDWHAIAFDPSDANHILAGTDGGVYTSFDGGVSWRAQNNGLAIAQFYPGISVHPSGLWVFGGLQDNQAAYFSGSPVWNNFSSLGDGGYTAVNYNNPSIVFVTHAFQNFIQRKSGSFTQEDRSTGISGSDRSGIPRPIVMDPATPTTLYFGTQRLYKTLNEGLFWFPISFDLTKGSGFITTIAVAPSDPRVIYVGTSDGVISVSEDAGASFHQFVFATARHFTRIAVDPIDPLHAIATASTFAAPKITQTHDGGFNFSTSISSNLQNIPVHTVLFIPGTSLVMIGAEYGVLQTSDDGFSWAQGPPGMPNAVVYDLAYAATTNTVVASTYGRGMFAYKLGASTQVLRGDVDRDSRVSAADAFLLQQALVGVDLSPLSPYPQGDANCDTKLEGVDVLLVLRSAVGLPTPGACVGTVTRIMGPDIRPR